MTKIIIKHGDFHYNNHDAHHNDVGDFVVTLFYIDEPHENYDISNAVPNIQDDDAEDDAAAADDNGGGDDVDGGGVHNGGNVVLWWKRGTQ